MTLFWILVQPILLWLHHWCQIRMTGVTVQSRWDMDTTRTVKEKNPLICAWAISFFLMFVSLWRLQLNLIRQNAKTILGLISTPSRLIVENPEADDLSLVSLSEKSCQKEGGNGLQPAQSCLRISRREVSK